MSLISIHNHKLSRFKCHNNNHNQPTSTTNRDTFLLSTRVMDVTSDEVNNSNNLLENSCHLDGEEEQASIAKYNLRTKSIQNRIEVERRKSEPRHPKPKQKPAPLSKYRRKTANFRERCRMQEMNDAFKRLQSVVPDILSQKRDPSDQSGLAATSKVTKISTLKLAVDYISALTQLLTQADNATASFSTRNNNENVHSLVVGVGSNAGINGHNLKCTSSGGLSSSSTNCMKDLVLNKPQCQLNKSASVSISTTFGNFDVNDRQSSHSHCNSHMADNCLPTLTTTTTPTKPIGYNRLSSQVNHPLIKFTTYNCTQPNTLIDYSQSTFNLSTGVNLHTPHDDVTSYDSTTQLLSTTQSQPPTIQLDNTFSLSTTGDSLLDDFNALMSGLDEDDMSIVDQLIN